VGENEVEVRDEQDKAIGRRTEYEPLTARP
jgi:hypothetical protein